MESIILLQLRLRASGAFHAYSNHWNRMMW